MKIQMHQIRQLNAELNTLGKRLQLDPVEMKREMIHDVTKGRTEHTKELSFEEADMLIDHIKRFLDSKETVLPEGDRIRKSILSMCYTMNIINELMHPGEKIQKVNEFILKHEKIGLKKRLAQYSVKELQNLHYQFEVFTKHYLSKI